MKKILVVLLTALCIAGIVACISGCEDIVETHSYDKQVVSEKYLAKEATCTEAARYYYSCECGEKGTETFEYGDPLGHTYSDKWDSDGDCHWHNATCGHTGETTVKESHSEGDWIVDVKVSYDQAGQRHKECTVCKRVLRTEKLPKLTRGQITFDTLVIDANNSAYAKVANSKTTFNFNEEISVGDNTEYAVSLDVYGINVSLTKIVPLAEGDNTFYILVTASGEITTYTITIRRRPMYTVSFDTNGGTTVASQRVEEDSFATEPQAPEKAGYAFDGWDFDFTQAVTGNTRINAKWTANADTPYKVEYYWQNIENDNYTLHETNNLKGVTYTKVTAEQKTYDHFTLNTNKSVLSGNIAGNGSLVLKLYYTRDKYTVTLEKNVSFAGNITGINGTYKYGTELTLNATTNLGYIFNGWYQGEKSVSAQAKYTLTIVNDVVLTAEWTTDSKMSNFEFYSTATTCKITGVKDKTITSVEIPDYVTAIGYEAFKGCKGLTSITIPDSVSTIGDWAFRECSIKNIYINDLASWCKISGLYYLMEFSSIQMLYLNNEEVTNLIIPNGITSIGEYAFHNCKGLTSVTISDSVTSIGLGAFSYCSKLTSVTIGKRVTSICEQAFSQCNMLEKIYINDLTAWCKISGLNNLSKSKLFLNGEEITILEIPANVASISDNAFSGCSGITSVIIPNSVTSIGAMAFSWCSGLTSVSIPDSLTSIGAMAFIHCSGLTSVTIPNSVTSIGLRAFELCSKLTSVIIPDSVNYIGDEAFSGCSGLETIEVATTNTTYHSFNNCLIETATKTLIVGCKNSVIPNDGSVISIGNYAFSGCIELTSIIIPDSVTSIGDQAFMGCINLKSITISDNVTSIGEWAFSNCIGLTSITITNSLTFIGPSAFYNCKVLKSITFEGTMEQWQAISKGTSWNYNVPASVVHCTDEDVNI